MPTAEAAMNRRKERIDYAKGIVMRSNGESYDRTIAVVADNTGATITKAKEYLDLLRKLGIFRVKDNKIVIPERSDSDEQEK